MCVQNALNIIMLPSDKDLLNPLQVQISGIASKRCNISAYFNSAIACKGKYIKQDAHLSRKLS